MKEHHKHLLWTFAICAFVVGVSRCSYLRGYGAASRDYHRVVELIATDRDTGRVKP